MATIRIPTPLRKLTQGKEEVSAAGGTDRRADRQPRDAVPGHQGADLRRQRPGPPLREHLRQRRGHPLPQEPGHARQGHATRSRSSRPSRAGAEPARGRRALRPPDRAAGDRSRGTGANSERCRAVVVGDDLAAEMAAALSDRAPARGRSVRVDGRRRRLARGPGGRRRRRSIRVSTTTRLLPCGRVGWGCRRSSCGPSETLVDVVSVSERAARPDADAEARSGARLDAARLRRRHGGAGGDAGGGRGDLRRC